MFENITTTHSLYMLRDDDVRHFQSMAKRHHLPGFEDVRFFQPLDSWVAVMNVWCLLREKDCDYQMNFDKTMAYSATFYSLSLLRKEEQIWHYLSMKKDDDLVFLLAYFVTDELLDWTEAILYPEEDGESLISKNRKRDYFALFEEEAIRLDENHEIYKEQKLLTNAMAHNYSAEEHFHAHIKNAIARTKEYLTSWALHPTK